MDDSWNDIRRRDLIKASLATVGAATLGAKAGPADAQISMPPPSSAADETPRGTVYTGEILDGKKVVSALDVDDLEPGVKHLLYFQGVEMRAGQHWHVSVIVARGAKPGKRVVLTSGVHGDEMSSIHTVMTVMNQLDPVEMSGTVMAVTDISRPALLATQRKWPNSSRSIDLVDLNREWPGNERGSAPARHAALVFNRLLASNADAAIDFHTGTTGFEVSAFTIASLDVPEVKAMTDLYPVGQILDMPQNALSHHPAQRASRRGRSGALPRGRRRAHPRQADDRAVRGGHDECPQAPRRPFLVVLRLFNRTLRRVDGRV